MNTTFISLLSFGFLLGVKHAFDADHITAVSTLSKRNPSLTGLLWGLGHTITILIVGLIVLSLKIAIPEKLALSFEFIVGGMLIIMGFSILTTLDTHKIHFHKHKHEEEEHIHFHSHSIEKTHNHYHQPLLIGLIHGLAGSAAVTLLVLSTINSFWIGLFYILIFGFGSIIGMVSASNIISLPFRLIPNKFGRMDKILRLCTSLLSIAIGFSIIYQIVK